jgi:hypothetical protein
VAAWACGYLFIPDAGAQPPGDRPASRATDTFLTGLPGAANPFPNPAIETAAALVSLKVRSITGGNLPPLQLTARANAANEPRFQSTLFLSFQLQF